MCGIASIHRIGTLSSSARRPSSGTVSVAAFSSLEGAWSTMLRQNAPVTCITSSKLTEGHDATCIERCFTTTCRNACHRSYNLCPLVDNAVGKEAAPICRLVYPVVTMRPTVIMRVTCPPFGALLNKICPTLTHVRVCTAMQSTQNAQLPLTQGTQ